MRVQSIFINLLLIFFILISFIIVIVIVIVEALHEQGANIKLAPDTLEYYANCY